MLLAPVSAGGLRLAAEIRNPFCRGEVHGLFGFFTPADNSAPEANGDDQH
jgi:hypothetical protein